jgi:tRNA (cmo5U34)-methyltransferase
MNQAKISYFDQAAATWDDNPSRIALMKAVGEGILREAQPTKSMDVLDYGCGTGLVGLYLLPHVRSVTGADNSAGMLDVLQKKVKDGDFANMRTVRLDLEHDRVPTDRYHLVDSNMTLHHIAETTKVLASFYELLLPGGILCIADLDTEPGLFHAPEVAPNVRHHGFDREALKSQLATIGFKNPKDITAHIIRKPGADGAERDFPVFLITAWKDNSR